MGVPLGRGLPVGVFARLDILLSGVAKCLSVEKR
jgi:hypothetical protein